MVEPAWPSRCAAGVHSSQLGRGLRGHSPAALVRSPGRACATVDGAPALSTTFARDFDDLTSDFQRLHFRNIYSFDKHLCELKTCTFLLLLGNSGARVTQGHCQQAAGGSLGHAQAGLLTDRAPVAARASEVATCPTERRPARGPVARAPPAGRRPPRVRNSCAQTSFVHCVFAVSHASFDLRQRNALKQLGVPSAAPPSVASGDLRLLPATVPQASRSPWSPPPGQRRF